MLRVALCLATACLFAVTACDDDNDSGADTATTTETDTTADTDTADTDTASGRLDDNGCTYAAATDMTGQSAVTITDIAGWMVPHAVCIKVSAGTVVTWEGNFGPHPLTGGATPESDDTSPITIAGPGSGTDPVVVTFSAAGDFPYFCLIHRGSMQGVVYVD